MKLGTMHGGGGGGGPGGGPYVTVIVEAKAMHWPGVDDGVVVWVKTCCVLPIGEAGVNCPVNPAAVQALRASGSRAPTRLGTEAHVGGGGGGWPYVTLTVEAGGMQSPGFEPGVVCTESTVSLLCPFGVKLPVNPALCQAERAPPTVRPSMSGTKVVHGGGGGGGGPGNVPTQPVQPLRIGKVDSAWTVRGPPRNAVIKGVISVKLQVSWTTAGSPRSLPDAKTGAGSEAGRSQCTSCASR